MYDVRDFVCDDCGAKFNEDNAGEELFVHDEVRPRYVERFIKCPKCGSTRFEEAMYCKRCKEPFAEHELRGGYYCDECLEEITTPYHMKLFIKEDLDRFAEWMFLRRQKGGADEQPN